MIKRLLLIGLALATPVAAAQKIDLVRDGAPFAAVIKVSETTTISYTGVTPGSFTGTLDNDDSTYNRPVTCTALSGVGTAVPFDTLILTNNASGTANIVVTSSLVGGGACGDANDTFFTLYNGTFTPASSLTNCQAVNDDIAAAANRCSTLSFSIPAGQTRTLVIAGFNNATDPAGLFTYQINFSGTTPVELLEFSAD
jgi:hypothetical protein